MQLNHYANSLELDAHFADKVAKILTEAIRIRGQAYLIVSGGKTPRGFFKALANKDLAWNKVTISLTDERWLPPFDKECNESMLCENLLQDFAAKAYFMSLLKSTTDYSLAINLANQSMENLPIFDVVILGMGEDGHTASLFPDSPSVKEALVSNSLSVIGVTPLTAAYQRISLTKKRLINTHNLFLHIIGGKKLAVLKAAITNQNLPISAFTDIPSLSLQVMYAES